MPRDIAELVNKMANLETNTVLYRVGKGQMSRVDAVLKFIDIENRREKSLKINEKTYQS